MLKKSESHYLIFTLAELICLGCAWMQYDWVLYFLLVLLLAQLAYSIYREIRRRSGTKICPLCKMHVVIWYRICPNCGCIGNGARIASTGFGGQTGGAPSSERAPGLERIPALFERFPG